MLRQIHPNKIMVMIYETKRFLEEEKTLLFEQHWKVWMVDWILKSASTLSYNWFPVWLTSDSSSCFSDMGTRSCEHQQGPVEVVIAVVKWIGVQREELGSGPVRWRAVEGTKS